MINYVVAFILLSNALIFAEDLSETFTKETGSFTYCIKENQKIDTSDWITFPIDFGYFNIETGIDGLERVTVSLPSEPQFVQKNGMNLLTLLSVIKTE